MGQDGEALHFAKVVLVGAVTGHVKARVVLQPFAGIRDGIENHLVICFFIRLESLL